jgi:hypothetical protein
VTLKQTLKRILGKGQADGSEDSSILPHGVVEDTFARIHDRCRPYTLTTAQEMYALHNAARHIVRTNLPGSIVECGVWKGGSAMICALTLLDLDRSDRDLYLYDTYEGMSAPTDKDVTHTGETAAEIGSRFEGHGQKWTYAPYEEVQAAVLSTSYPKERVHFVKGKVEDTIPATIPESIALLRLDTDFYESTYHELTHLYPLLAPGGILIIDDYDYWRGSREATDQYFAENDIQMLLHRMDVGRIGIKPA